MFNKPEKDYLINVVLIIMTVVCIVTGFMLTSGPFSSYFTSGNGIDFRLYGETRNLHTWTGYILTGLFVLHLLMHYKWIILLSKKFFASKTKIIGLVTAIAISIGICYAIIDLTPQRRGIGGPPFGVGASGFSGGMPSFVNQNDQSGQLNQSAQPNH